MVFMTRKVSHASYDCIFMIEICSDPGPWSEEPEKQAFEKDSRPEETVFGLVPGLVPPDQKKPVNLEHIFISL